MDDDNLAYGTMDTGQPKVTAGSKERIERPQNDRTKTTYTFPIKIMPSPKSATTSSANLTPEFTEFETQAYYNESLDYNYISSRFAFSLGLKPDADREGKPRSKSISKPKVPFKAKGLVRSHTAPIAEIKPLQRSRTEPLSRRIFAPLNRENTISGTISEDVPASTSTSTPSNPPIPPRIPPRRTSTTATLVPSNSQAPPIFSLLEPTPDALQRSGLKSPLFPDKDMNPFSPRPDATFGGMIVDTPPRTPQRPSPIHSQTEGQQFSLFEALSSHPVIPTTNIPSILTEGPEGMSEEPQTIPEEPETPRNFEAVGTGTGIGMGFGVGEEIRGRENLDPDSMTGDLTLHWKSSPLSRYTQRTVFWIVPNAKFDIVFGHDETDFNIPIHNAPKWGLGGFGVGGGRGRRAERNQFREGIRRGVLKKVEEQSTFSLLYSATNLMDAWLRPPYSANVSTRSAHSSDSKRPLLSNSSKHGDEYGDENEDEENIHKTVLTLPELEYQLRAELNCSDERRRKHEARRAVNIWDVRAGKAVLDQQAKGASGEIRKLVGAVVKDVKERSASQDSGKGKRAESSKIGESSRAAVSGKVGAESAHDKFVHAEIPSSVSTTTAAALVPSTSDVVAVNPHPKTAPEHLFTRDIPQEPLPTEPEPVPVSLKTEAIGISPPLPARQTFEIIPTTANQSASSSLRVEFTDAQLQAQIQTQMDLEAEREAEREMEREMQAQMEREVQEQIDAEMNAQVQTQAPALPPRPQRFSISESAIDSESLNANLNPKKSDIHASISAFRSAHHDHDEDSDSEDSDHEVMSEILLSKIPIQRLDLSAHEDDLRDLEQMSEIGFSLPKSTFDIALPDRSFGTLAQRFERKWEMEDEGVHVERKIWRGKFRGVLGELLRVRELRV